MEGTDSKPAPGDFSVCTECGAILVFAVVPLLPSEHDLKELAQDADASRKLAAASAFFQKRHRDGNTGPPLGVISSVEWASIGPGQFGPVARASDAAGLGFGVYSLCRVIQHMPEFPPEMKRAAGALMKAIRPAGKNESIAVEVYRGEGGRKT